MTKLNKPVARESGICDQGEELIASLDPKLGFTLRYKRQRKVWHVSFLDCLDAMKRRDGRSALLLKRAAKVSLTIDELRRDALTVLEGAKAKFLATGDFLPAILLAKDGSFIELPFPPSWMNSPDAKSFLFDSARAMAARHKADAVICLSDIWTLEFTPEQRTRLDEDSEHREAFERIGDVSKAAALDYGELREAILVMAQTPLVDVIAVQIYQREPVRFGTLTVRDTSEPGSRSEGRMRFFDRPATRSAQ